MRRCISQVYCSCSGPSRGWVSTPRNPFPIEIGRMITKTIDRRAFLQTVAVVVPSWSSATRASAQTAPGGSEWGTQVLDIHLHPRATVEGNILHMDGAGVTRAVLLTGAA